MSKNIGDSILQLAGMGDIEGPQKYKKLWAEAVADRARRLEDQDSRISTLEQTLKTMNGAAQLAVQQVHALKAENDALRKQLQLPNPETKEEKGE